MKMMVSLRMMVMTPIITVHLVEIETIFQRAIVPLLQRLNFINEGCAYDHKNKNIVQFIHLGLYIQMMVIMMT